MLKISPRVPQVLDWIGRFLARRSVRVAFVLLMFLGGAALSFTRYYFDEVTLEFDAEIDRGNYMELYFNERWPDYIVQDVLPGVRNSYVFHGLPSKLFALRLDPTNVAQARVRIYAIRIKRGARTLQEYLPPHISGWVNTQLDVTANSSPSVYEAISSDTDPIMRLPGPWHIASERRVIKHLEKVFESEQRRNTFDLAVVAGGALLMLFMSRPRRAFLVAYLPLGVLVMIRCVGAVLKRLPPILNGYLSSDVAVGWSNYTGYPKQFEFRALLVAVAMMIGGAWLAARWLRKRWPEEHEAQELAAPPRENTPRRRYLEFATLGLLIFLVAMALAMRLPNYNAFIRWMNDAHHNFSYDDQNFFTWRYCTYAGWQPLRDFWYPYGDFMQLDGFWAWGAGRDFLHRLILHGVFTSCVYILCNRSAARTAVMVAGGILASHGYSDVGAEQRYALALNLVLLMLVCRQLGWSRLPALALGAFAGYCMIYEPHQILYASVALAAVWGGDFLWPRQGQTRGALLSTLYVAGGTFGLCAIVRVLLLAIDGRLAGQLEFIRQSGPMVVYGAIDAQLLTWFHAGSDQAVILFWGMLFLVGYGAFLRTYRREGEWHQLGVICLALGLLTAVVLNKQVTRPHVAWQLLPYIELGLMFILMRVVAHVRLRERGVLLLVVIYLLGKVGALQIVPFAAENAQILIGNVPKYLRGVADGDALDRMYKSYFFDENRYPTEKPLIQRMKQLLAEKKSDGVKTAPLYVFGDEPFLYAPLHQKPAYYITFYNASPLRAQERMVQWLTTRRPDFVVWRPSRKAFDEVPHSVRVPLMFRTVIADYELLERVGDYHILVPRPAGKPIDLAYYREALGGTFDVGALPAHSRLAKLRSCDTSRDNDCAEVLHVHIATPRLGERATLRMSSGDQEFTLSLRHEEGIHDYYVPLSRIWFYEALRQNDPQKKESFVGTPDLTFNVENLAGAAKILY